MQEKSEQLISRIVANDDATHVYEIYREFEGREGQDIILVTLFPTGADPSKCDLSTLHMLNHTSDKELGIKSIHFVYLFSKVSSTRISARNLQLDTENLLYFRKILTQYPNAKIVVSFGSSMSQNSTVIESKTQMFQIIKECRANETLWQISADGAEEECIHILFAGIKYGNANWKLIPYIVPYKYTPEGFEKYKADREAAKERFAQRLLGRSKVDDAPTTTAEKGKKKNVNKESR